MCWKKKPPIVIVPAKRRLLTFGKNVYPGNSLNGCWNDSLNLSDKALGMFSDFDIRKYRDGDVTADRYLTEAKNAIQLLSPGATVLVMADSCYSGSVTRAMSMGCQQEKHPTKARFFYPGIPPRQTKKKAFSTEGMNHVLISGCGEHETSNDAYINGKYAGAFTFYAVAVLVKGMTYKQWFEEIRKYLPSDNFNQSPQLEGPEHLINRVVFEDETLIIHNSSHGSYTYDTNGDEADGQDEGLYFNRLVIDDEIREMLNAIPV